MAVSASATALWKAVVDRENERLEDSNLTRKWRLASNLRAECAVCEEKGGVLIGCASEKCTKYVHLDCANQVEGLLLNEDGIFVFECEKHHKPPVFCSCKQKYDNMKEYICCDSCFEWYHHTCQKVTPEQKNDSSYICSSCKAIENSGKSVPQELKDSNLEKEARSNDMIRSEKIIGFILPLVLDVCPLIDSISEQSTESIKIGDVSDAINLLSTSINNLSSHSFYDQLDEEVLMKLGVIEVFNQWLNICEDFLSRWNDWKQEIIQLCTDISNNVSEGGLWKDNGSAMLEFGKRASAIEDERKSSFKIIEDDLESYQLFTECLAWITEFLTAFFVSSKAENWTQSIGSLVRTGQSKLLKRLNNFSNTKKDDVYAPLSTWFRPVVQEVEMMVNTITRWHNNVCTVILGKDAQWEIQEAEQFIQESEQFPTLPPLRKDLDEIYAAAFSIIDKIDSFLSSSDYSEEVYAQLMDEKDDIGLKLSFEDELDCIKEHGVFLKAFGMVSSGGRIHINQAKILIANAQGVEEDAVVIMKNNFPIAQALNLRLKQAKNELQEKVEKAENVIASLKIDSLESLIPSQLSIFQELPIITEEEEYLLFCKDADAAHELSEKIVSKSHATSLAELEDLAEKIASLIDHIIVADLESVRSRKVFLKSDLSAVANILQTAKREWEKLASALEDAKEGLAVSAEVVLSTLQHCRNTQIASDELEQETVAKLQEGEKLSQECEQTLAVLVEVSSQAVEQAEALVEKVRHSFVSSSIGTNMKLRCETLKTVLSCQNILQEGVSVRGDTNKTNVSQQLNTMRELKMSLLRLSSMAKAGSLEAKMISSVRDEFLYQQWCAEVRDLLVSSVKTSVSHAERLLEDARSMQLPLQEAPEFVQLNDAVVQCHHIRNEAKIAADEFQALLKSFQVPTEDYRSTMEVDESSSEEQHSDRLTSLTKSVLKLSSLWSTEAKSILERVRTFSSQVLRSPVMDHDISDAVGKISRGIEVIESVFVMFSIINDTLAKAVKISPEILPTFDAKYILEYQNAIQENLPDDSPIVMELRRVLDMVNNQVQRFVDTYVNLVPAFFTRQRNRVDSTLASKETLIAVLNEPIARAIRTPIHSRLLQVWNQVCELREKIRDFVIQPNQVKNTIKVGDQVHDEQEEEQLKNDLLTIEKLVNEAELIPLELPEATVLSWLKELWEWIERIPLPHTTDFEIDYEEALACKKEAIPLIQEIPGATIIELVGMKIMDVDENGSLTGFVADAHPRLQNVGDYFENLEKQIGLAETFSLKVERILATEVQFKDIEALLKEKESLVVLPPRACLRLLDRALEAHRQKKIATTSSFVQQKVEKKMTSKLMEAATIATQSHKKSSRLCARSGCSHALRLPITMSFCSDTCGVKSIEELAQGIIKYKTAIQAQKQAAAVGAQVSSVQMAHRIRMNDVKAFDLNPMKKAVDGISEDSKSPRASLASTTVLQSNSALSEIMHRLPAVAHDLLRLDKLKEKPSVTGTKDRSFRVTVRTTLEDIFSTILSKLNVKAAAFHAAMMAIDIEQGLYEKYDQTASGEYQKHFRMLNTNLKRPNNEYLIKKLADGETSVKELLSMTVKQFADQELQQQRELQKEALAKSTFIEKSRYDELDRRRREAMSGATEAWRDSSATATSSAEQFTVDIDPLMTTPTIDAGGLMDGHHPISPSASTDLSSPNNRGAFFRSTSEDSESFNTDDMTEIERRVLESSGHVSLKRSLSDSDHNSVGSSLPLSGGEKHQMKKPRIESQPSPRRSLSSELTGPSLLQRLKENNDLTRSTSGDSMDESESNLNIDDGGNDFDEEELAARRQQETLRRLMEEEQEKERQKRAVVSSAGSTLPKPAPSPKANINTIPSMRLLNKDGTEQFSISRPSGTPIRATALVSDKRVQGLVKGNFTIDGRTKIAELERFLGEVFAHGKKTVAVSVFLVPTEQSSAAIASSASYQKFVEEFASAERAGLCNASSIVQVYLVPPSLQSAISILRDIRMDSFPRKPGKPNEFQHQLLFAIIVAKESGPAQYVNRNFPPLPLVPNSFAVATFGNDAKGVPALLPVSTAAPSSGAPSFQRPSAFDSIPRPSIPQNIPNIAPSLGMGAQPAPVPERDQMRQIAEMCARQGPQSLDELRATPQNRFKLPFIYDGNPGYDEFKMMIIDFARNLAQQSMMSSNQPRPTMNMPALRPMMMGGTPGTMPMPMQPRPLMQQPNVGPPGGFPRPMMMGGPRPGGLMPMPSAQNPQQPPNQAAFPGPGQQPPRRSRFG